MFVFVTYIANGRTCSFDTILLFFGVGNCGIENGESTEDSIENYSSWPFVKKSHHDCVIVSLAAWASIRESYRIDAACYRITIDSRDRWNSLSLSLSLSPCVSAFRQFDRALPSFVKESILHYIAMPWTRACLNTVGGLLAQGVLAFG